VRTMTAAPQEAIQNVEFRYSITIVRFMIYAADCCRLTGAVADSAIELPLCDARSVTDLRHKARRLPKSLPSVSHHQPYCLRIGAAG
jgi:hypothetical protein